MGDKPTRAKRMQNAKSEDDVKWVREQEKLEAETTMALSKVVKYITRRMTQAEVAERTHVSRTLIANMLNWSPSKRDKRSWSIELLLAIARETGKTASEILTVAEELRDNPETPVEVAWANRMTAHSAKKSIQDMIFEAVDYDKEGDPTGVVAMLYREKDVEYAVPNWYMRCKAGALTGSEVRRVLEAAARMHKEKDGVPFWAAVKMVVESETGGR